MKKTITLLILLLWLGSFFQASAQQREITGTVTNASDNQPLPGVTVIVKGGTSGSTTDIDGHYRIMVPASRHLGF